MCLVHACTPCELKVVCLDSPEHEHSSDETELVPMFCKHLGELSVMYVLFGVYFGFWANVGADKYRVK